MKRIMLAAACLLLIAACSNPPSKGYVYSINYNPPGSIWWPGHYYQSCSGSGSYRTCYTEWDPGYTEYIPPEWQIQLCKQPGQPSSSNACGWRDVDEQTWHSVRLGQFWTTVAS